MTEVTERLKQAAADRVDALRDTICDLNQQLYDNPEIAFQETRAAAWLTDLLDRDGFTVERKVADLDTAFRATFRDSSREGATVAFLAEYDALPKLGHACCHNMIGMGSVGAAMALRPPHEGRTPEDKISLEENAGEVSTYSIPKKAASMDSGFSFLREMLAEILEEQGITTRIASEDTSIDFRDLTPEKARELISEDGYFGVEQTADRIVQFAISISGNDPSRLEEIKVSIDKSFQMASKALGGTLPDICMKTYDAVMDKLNAWAEGSDESASRTDNHGESTDTE